MLNVKIFKILDVNAITGPKLWYVMKDKAEDTTLHMVLDWDN